MTNPATMKALAERLRGRNERFQSTEGSGLYYGGSDSILDVDAATALDTAAAEIKRLRGGVEVKELKCALCGEDHDNDLGSDICTTCEARADWTGLDANEARIRSAIQGGENAE